MGSANFVEWIIAVLLIPLIVMLARGMVRWVRTEDKLNELVEDVRKLVDDKDRTHREISEQMRFDRDATNKRLRYLEEYFMSHGMGRQGR